MKAISLLPLRADDLGLRPRARSSSGVTTSSHSKVLEYEESIIKRSVKTCSPSNSLAGLQGATVATLATLAWSKVNFQQLTRLNLSKCLAQRILAHFLILKQLAVSKNLSVLNCPVWDLSEQSGAVHAPSVHLTKILVQPFDSNFKIASRISQRF